MDPLQLPGASRVQHDCGLSLPQETFRLTQLMQDASRPANSDGATHNDIQHALAASWKVLSAAGYTRFGSVVTLRPLDFADHVKTTRPDIVQPLSIALDTIAWHQFNNVEGAPDKAVQFLQRATLLAPPSATTLYHYADSTLLLNDEHLRRITDPAIRRTTLQGYRGSAQDAILQTLNSACGISENVLRGNSSDKIEHVVTKLTPEDRELTYNLLGKLAALCNLSGTDRGKLGLLNLSIAASSCQLALLGHGRDLKLIVTEFIDRLGNCDSNTDVENFLQVKSPLILNILSQLGTTTWNKGMVLSEQMKDAPDAKTRLSMEKDYHLMQCLSEDIDAILDLLEPIN